jgi:hypothetical protein
MRWKRVTPMRAIPISCGLYLMAHAALAGAAKSPLEGTWWNADVSCYITDVILQPEGRAIIFYQDGRNDGGRWTFSGSTLTIIFETYDDSFTGRYNGATIRATHTWSEDRRTRRSEDCVLTEINGPAT